MAKGIKINTGTAKALILLAAIAAIGFILACASAPPAQRDWKETAKPGLYSLTGWGNWIGDVDGEVGHSLYVGSPTAWCLPSRNWSLSHRILSGALPPGLSVSNTGASNITGIPTERGHWIVKLQVYNIQCGGQTYDGFEQEIRFHITGSGKVIQ